MGWDGFDFEEFGVCMSIWVSLALYKSFSLVLLTLLVGGGICLSLDFLLSSTLQGYLLGGQRLSHYCSRFFSVSTLAGSLSRHVR